MFNISTFPHSHGVGFKKDNWDKIQKNIILRIDITKVGRNLIIQNSTPIIKGSCSTNGCGFTPRLKDDFQVLLWHSHGESKTNWTNNESNKFGISDRKIFLMVCGTTWNMTQYNHTCLKVIVDQMQRKAFRTIRNMENLSHWWMRELKLLNLPFKCWEDDCCS